MDAQLFEFVVVRRIPALNHMMMVLSARGFLVAVCLAWAMALLFAIRNRRAGVALLALVAAIGLADVLGARLIKPWVDRPRPCHVRPEIALPGACGPGKSMPSNHAARLGAGAAVVAFLLRRRGLLFSLPPLIMVCLSRVYLGVHFPSDVLAGVGLGVASGVVVLGTLRLATHLLLRTSHPTCISFWVQTP